MAAAARPRRDHRGFAYCTGIAASRRLGSRLASFVALLEVVAGVTFAWLLLDQLPGPLQLAGGALSWPAWWSSSSASAPHTAPDDDHHAQAGHRGIVAGRFRRPAAQGARLDRAQRRAR